MLKLKHPITHLAFAETILWGGIYYIFPALLLHWEKDFGWARTDISLALMLAVLVSAVVAPLAGKIIDQGYGKQLLTFSAAFGAGLLGLLTVVDNLYAFYGIWVVMGVAMAGCLYEPCFAFVTAYKGAEAKRPITMITLVAGFASTFAFPFISGMTSAFDWRTAVWGYVAIILLIAVPQFWFSTGRIAKENKFHRDQEQASSDPVKIRKIIRVPAFWLIALGFSIVALNHGMIITHILPLLDEWGVTLDAATLTVSMIGPMQVAGRLAMMAAEKKVSSIFITAAAFFGVFVASLSLLGSEAVPSLLVAFVLLQGACYGVTSILKPVVIGDVLGRRNFGAISGAATVPYLIAYAVAPYLGAWIWSVSGYDMMLYICAAFAFMGFLAFVWIKKKYENHQAAV